MSTQLTGRIRRLASLAALTTVASLALTGCAFEFEVGAGGESTSQGAPARPAGSGTPSQDPDVGGGADRDGADRGAGTTGRPSAPPAATPPGDLPAQAGAPTPPEQESSNPAPSASRRPGGSGTIKVINGTWSGTATQAGFDPYTIDVVISGSPGEQVATVEYPELDCVGRWTITRTADTTYQARETIDRGRCVPTVRIDLEQVDADTITYRVDSPRVTSTLRRR